VIECQILPFFLVVAFFAFFAVAAGMDVIDVMAGHAFPSQILIAFIGMTAIAGRLLMFASQGKFRLLMIETAGLPGLDAMTFPAIFPQALFVRVIFMVAVIAG